jgi:hypothetical protein
VLKDFRDALVAQKINAGVFISPWGVFNVPILARENLEFLFTLQLKLFICSIW